MALPEAGAVNRSQRVSANEGHELVRSVHITMRVIRCMSKDFSQPSSQHACDSAWIFLLSISVSFSSAAAEDKLMVKRFPNDYPITRNERSVNSVRMVVFLTDFLYKGREFLGKLNH